MLHACGVGFPDTRAPHHLDIHNRQTHAFDVVYAFNYLYKVCSNIYYTIISEMLRQLNIGNVSQGWYRLDFVK